MSELLLSLDTADKRDPFPPSVTTNLMTYLINRYAGRIAAVHRNVSSVSTSSFDTVSENNAGETLSDF